MKKQSISFVRISIGCLYAGAVSMPTLANPFAGPEVTNTSVYAESRNVPRFKLTYSRLHNASMERRRKAEMAAMEVRRKNPALSGGEDGKSVNKKKEVKGAPDTP